MNVLLTEDWIAKVSDFGLARHRTETKASMTTRGGGTFRWAAPETFDDRFNEKSDVYSCGITIYELITRALPFGGMGEPAIMKMVYMMGKRPELSAVEPGCPTQLQAIMQRCWEHEPADRPTFAELAETLAALVQDYDNMTGPLNAPGHWDFFVSHTQRSGRATTLATKLFGSLKEVWLDVEMNDKSEAAMKEGVLGSEAVLAVITDEGIEGSACFGTLR